jgi:hypothetical protein
MRKGDLDIRMLYKIMRIAGQNRAQRNNRVDTSDVIGNNDYVESRAFFQSDAGQAWLAQSKMLERHRREIPPLREPTHSQEANGEEKVGSLRSE